jgi:hypothetical protein
MNRASNRSQELVQSGKTNFRLRSDTSRRASQVRRMEPLWSPVVATGGNQQQIGRPSKPQKQAKSVATGCHRLPETFHGKDGVDGSSPSEGSAKAPQNRASSVGCTCTISSVRWVWSPLWSLQIENSVLKCAWPHAVGATNLPIRERASAFALKTRRDFGSIVVKLLPVLAQPAQFALPSRPHRPQQPPERLLMARLAQVT